MYRTNEEQSQYQALSTIRAAREATRIPRLYKQNKENRLPFNLFEVYLMYLL